jgi:hypothetical protein
MTSDKDFIGVLEEYLDEYEGATPLPESVRDAVRAQLPTTNQVGPLSGPMRYPSMFNLPMAARYGLAAAVLLAAAVIGVSFFSSQNVGGLGPVEVPSATATPTPTRVPTAPSGQLEPGTYRFAQFTRRAFTVTVPEGWSRDNNFLGTGSGTAESDAFQGNGVYFATWMVSHVYSDSCQWEGALRPTESVGELIQALAEQGGHETTAEGETELGGLPATQFEFSVPSDFDIAGCDQEFMRLWPDAGPNENYGLPIAVGQIVTVYVVDIDGEAQLVIAGHKEASTAADVAELESVVASLHFEEP